MAAGVTLTAESAKGAAALTAQGKSFECWIEAAGRTRFCSFVGASEDGSLVTLRTYVGGDAKYADVAVSRVHVADATRQKCLLAYSQSQAKPGETLGARMGRQASESVDVINARLWAARQLAKPGVRRDVGGRFAGHSCEPAGRR